MLDAGDGFGGIGLFRRGVGAVSGADVEAGVDVTVRRVELSPLGSSGGCGLLMPLVNERGDCVAAQGESDHHPVLAGGGVGGDAAAVEGAVEGVVEGFGVFAPAGAAVVDAVAVLGFGVLAEVFGAVIALLEVAFDVGAQHFLRQCEDPLADDVSNICG